MPLDLIAIGNNFKKISIYENKDSFFFIGFNSTKKFYNIFTIKKIEYDFKLYNFTLKEILLEHKKDLSYSEILEYFEILGKLENTKLYHVIESIAIFGFIKFMIGYYAIVVTKALKVGKIGQHKIKRVENYKIISLYSTKEHPLIEMENK